MEWRGAVTYLEVCSFGGLFFSWARLLGFCGVLWSWWRWILWWAGVFDLGSGRGREWGIVRLGSRG